MLQDPTNEIWKDIPGFESIYIVSNTGKVKSLTRTLYDRKRKCYLRTIPTSILKPEIKRGYYKVNLYKDGKFRSTAIHIIVASCFVNGYFPGAVVNHKDLNKLNNNYWNLEWTTQKLNAIHALNAGALKITPYSKRKKPKQKKIVDLNTGKIYKTIDLAAAEVNIPKTQLSLMLRIPIRNTTSLRYLSAKIKKLLL